MEDRLAWLKHSQLLHAADESCPRNAEAGRGAVGPPMVQLVSFKIPRMCARSASDSVWGGPGIAACISSLSSVVRGDSTRPWVTITERSTKFCNSRMLPGQWCAEDFHHTLGDLIDRLA